MIIAVTVAFDPSRRSQRRDDEATLPLELVDLPTDPWLASSCSYIINSSEYHYHRSIRKGIILNGMVAFGDSLTDILLDYSVVHQEWARRILVRPDSQERSSLYRNFLE